MSIRSLELEILEGVRELSGNHNIRLKDIMEWSTGEVKAEEGETLYYLEDLGIHVSVKLPVEKVKKYKSE